jgi:hypothetical protein
MAGGAAGVPAVVSVVEVIKNAEVDLRLGITADGRIVVVIRELVQCALLMSERGAQRFLSDPANQDLAQTIGMVALETARWHGAKSDQVTCDVKHVETVFDWAVEGHGGINVMVQEQRDELVAAVHKAACDLAATRLTRARDAMADSIGVDIAGVDAEVNRLRAGLESAKAQAQDVITQLQHMHTELSGVREEASRGSTALAAQQQLLIDLKGRTCKTLEADVKDLSAQRAAQEAQRVPEEVSRFSAREGASAKRPRDSDSAAEVDARRSFVALYAPSVVGTEWTELVLPGGSSVVPAAVFNCPATEGPQEQWVQMALYGGAFVFGVLADVLEAKNARECKGQVDVPESAHQKQLNRKNTWQRFAVARTDKTSTGKASILDGNVFYLPSESDPCGGQGVGDRGPAVALINMAGVRALVKVTITLSTLSLLLCLALELPSLLSLSTKTT